MHFKEFYDRIIPKEVLEDTKPKLFCDMDGVLCDFAGEVLKIDGKTTINDIENLPEKTFWNFIQKAKGGLLGFFSNMDFLPEGKKLWQYIKDKNPTILSAVKEPGKADAIKGKNIWLDREVGVNQPRIFCERCDKQKQAKGNILIDDYEKNIEEWTKAGGKAILFRTADKAIEELNQLLK